MHQVTTAEFFGTPVSIIDHNGKRWLTAEQAGRCLGYAEANARQGIINIYNRHADEFTEADTCEINLISQGQTRTMRVFSDTGCIKLGFFSNTPRAKDFRTWVARVLAGQAAVPPAPTLGRSGRPLVATRRLEREVFEMFVAGWGPAQIAKAKHCSCPLVTRMLRASYYFSPEAGEPEYRQELIDAVVARHVELDLAKLAADRERLRQKYRANSRNLALADGMDRAAQELESNPLFGMLASPEGGAA